MGRVRTGHIVAFVAAIAAAAGCTSEEGTLPLTGSAASSSTIDEGVLVGASSDSRAGADRLRITHYTEIASLRFGSSIEVRVEYANLSSKPIPAASLGASAVIIDDDRHVIGSVTLTAAGGDLAGGGTAAFTGRLALAADAPRTHCEQVRTILWNGFAAESGRLTDYDQARSSVRIDCNSGLGYTMDQVPNEEALVAQVDRDYPGLMATNCAAFQRRVMERLRAKDTNWGYCNTGTLTWADRFVYGPYGAMVDAIVSACSPTPRVGWRLEPYNPLCVWGPTQLMPAPQDGS
jgi:hypothetical protein